MRYRMRIWLTTAIIAVTTAGLCAQSTTQAVGKSSALVASDRQFMSGQYDAAADGYRKRLSHKTDGVVAVVGLSKCLAMRGRYADALKTLDAMSETGVRNVAWHLQRSEMLAMLGRYTEALAAAQWARKFQSDSAEAILSEGMLLETLGRKGEALKIYKTMSSVVTGEAWKNDPAAMVALGQILDRYSVLSGKRASEQAPNILHNYLQKAYQDVDAGYWPAHLAAGWFLLSKHRASQAAQEFTLALKRNRHLPEAMLGLAVLQVGRYQFEKCLKLTDAARKINPHNPDVYLVRAVCFMQWRKFDRVQRELDAALKINPNHLDALSLAAALQMRLFQPDKAKPFIDRVTKINPRYAHLYNTIGEWLASGRQFTEAEKHYRRAIVLAPELADPVTNLGLMYMQTGDEAEGRKILQKAHAIDDYRKDVVLYLNVLSDLDKFAVKETEHFIVKVAPGPDGVLLDQVSEYLESIYGEVTRDFGHQPKRKTLVEFFPKHAQFSARISGRGWIPTVGASTGTVIVMVSPNKKVSTFGQYNWATVLRHEYTHTVTLAATGNRIPHWFTEACAVWQQPDRRNYDAVNLLVMATRTGRLMPIRELDWGFIRPRRRGDRSLAYAQAEWAMEYIIETKGFDAITRMLKGFHDGLNQATVFKQVLGVTEKQFDKAFRAYAKKDVTRWGFKSTPPPHPTRAAAAAKARPNDANAQATLAEALINARRYPQAEAAAMKALVVDKDHSRALAMLAQSLLAQAKLAKKAPDKDALYKRAALVGERLAAVNPKSRTALHVKAACYLQQRQWARAIAALEALKARQPLVPHSYRELARIYRLLGDNEKALPNLIELHRRTMNDPQYARQIAEIYSAMGKSEPAIRYLKQIAQINPYEATAYESMAAIYRLDEQYDKAVAAIANVCLLQPESADAWAKMAMMRFLAGRRAGDAVQLKLAREAADKALEIDASSQAAQIRNLIDATLKQLHP